MTDLGTFYQISLNLLAFVIRELERLDRVFALFNGGIILPRRNQCFISSLSPSC